MTWSDDNSCVVYATSDPSDTPHRNAVCGWCSKSHNVLLQYWFHPTVYSIKWGQLMSGWN